jgi:hypothetical protein
LNNITAGVREREDANRTTEAGHLGEIQGVVANTLSLHPNGVVGFIVWLGLFGCFTRMLLLLSRRRVVRNANAEKLAENERAKNEE